MCFTVIICYLILLSALKKQQYLHKCFSHDLLYYSNDMCFLKLEILVWLSAYRQRVLVVFGSIINYPWTSTKLLIFHFSQRGDCVYTWLMTTSEMGWLQIIFPCPTSRHTADARDRLLAKLSTTHKMQTANAPFHRSRKETKKIIPWDSFLPATKRPTDKMETKLPLPPLQTKE